MERNVDYYIVFCIGADNFSISRDIRENENSYGMDEIFEYCILVAKMFEESEYIKDMSVSTYTALERFLETEYATLYDLLMRGEF